MASPAAAAYEPAPAVLGPVAALLVAPAAFAVACVLAARYLFTRRDIAA